MPESPQNLALSQLGADKISGGTWRLLTFSLFVFSVMLLGYLGLRYGFRPYVEAQIKEVDNKIDELGKIALPEDQERFIRFYFQLVNIQDLLENHVFASKFFPFLEQTTNKDIQFKSLNVNVAQSQVNLTGNAKDYQVFAQQLSAFQKRPEVIRVNTQGANADERGLVSFQIDLSVTPSLFK
jgi:hypothetical protein